MQTQYRVSIFNDHDTERPDESDAFRFVSFNSRHTNYEDPDNYLTNECETCEGAGIWPKGGSLDCSVCNGDGEVEEYRLADDVLAPLSYYEHGLCRWMVGPSTVPDPYGGFDTVNFAGVIVKGDSFDQEWYDGMTEDERANALSQSAETYTEWVNGECYGYVIERIDSCGECGAEQPGHIDSLGGLIGTDTLAEELGMALAVEDIDPNAFEITGEFGYVLDGDDERLRRSYGETVKYREGVKANG